ncbi:MAG: S9 family peptidase, partial [Thaumarchaeota archaeon]|nr:S9 family peptidase [Nitrososphaerota archaeon]
MLQPITTIAPYGSWKSPVSAKAAAASTNSSSEITLGKDGSIYFLERRPEENGRYVVMRYKPNDEIEEFTPREFNARNRVHEYGGGSFLATDKSVCFSNFEDQLVYRVDLNLKNS